MSDEVEATIRQVPCPSCGAAVGQPCRFPSGAVCRDSHAVRYRAAVDLGLIRPIDRPLNPTDDASG